MAINLGSFGGVMSLLVEGRNMAKMLVPYPHLHITFNISIICQRMIREKVNECLLTMLNNEE